MTILDQPIEIESEPIKKTGWTWFEKIGPPLLFLIAALRELFSVLWAYEGILMLSCFLAISYLIAYYWIDKPPIRNARTVLISILYGFAFFCGFFAFVLLMLFMPGGKEMIYVTGIIVASVVAIDVAIAARRTPVANPKTAIRIGIMTLILGVLYFVPKDAHIEFAYRNNPDFIKYYHEQSANKGFNDIWQEYTESHR